MDKTIIAWENVWSKRNDKSNLDLKYPIRNSGDSNYTGGDQYMFYRFRLGSLVKTHRATGLPSTKTNFRNGKALKRSSSTARASLDYEIWNEPDICANGSFTAEIYATLAIGDMPRPNAPANARVTPSRMLAHWTGSKATGNRNVAKY